MYVADMYNDTVYIVDIDPNSAGFHTVRSFQLGILAPNGIANLHGQRGRQAAAGSRAW